ncbi:NAD(P)H-hydrate dehydratase [bacterium]|nr:NAD(P)H-hydrate dehydratase [candidate division CSSED10-310 bacterium]
MKVAFSGQMKEIDRLTIEEIGIPGVVLMENAGREVVSALADRFDDLHTCRVIVCVGPGNNGGDGFVIARHLWNRGADVLIRAVQSDRAISGDANIHAQVCRNMGIPMETISDIDDIRNLDSVLHDSDIIIDALFGTGLKTAVTGLYARVITSINDSDAFVVSVDIPSGLAADSSRLTGPVVSADLTVTFGLPKPALVLYPAAHTAGHVVVADISIPDTVIDSVNLTGDILTPYHFPAFFTPRPLDAHKGRLGHLLVIAGSPGKTGAAILATRAAARSGTGLVSAAVPGPLNSILESSLIEPMTIPLPGPSSVFHPDHIPHLKQALIGKSSVLIGPGIGTDPLTAEFLKLFLPLVDVPLILDADALNIMASSSGPWQSPRGPRILTPHPGEFSRLTDHPVDVLLDDPLDIVTDYAVTNQCILVFKTARTVIAHPDGRFLINAVGNPGLATGGSGDILSGLIAGLAARMLLPDQAVSAGVFWHGLAADRTASIRGQEEMLAGDILDHLAEARHVMTDHPEIFNGTMIPYPDIDSFLDYP